jgi:formylglycine-generating enzyme required for sulfatase activity
MVGKAALLVCCIAAAACGRIGFDALAGAPDAAPMLSCTGLAPICGPTGTASCCGTSLVTGGTFYRSYDVAGDGMFPTMNAPATVSDFSFDTYEITVGRYRQFVNAGLGTQANPPAAGAGARTLNGMVNQGGWNPSDNTNLTANTAAFEAALQCETPYYTWTDSPGANEALPINCLTWYEAFAFCAWDGGFLPTEAEWNYAAAGGSDQRAYPWSSPPSSLTISCSYANYAPSAVCVPGAAGPFNRVGSESPAGDGKYGQADLGGNAWEWTLDSFNATYQTPCTDCANLTAASNKMFRGGGWNLGASDVRVALRSNATPIYRNAVGVRCARAP